MIMSNIKKTIPTIVGGAMLLGNVTSFAIDENANNNMKDEVSVSVNKETIKDETIIEVEGSESDIVGNKEDIVVVPGNGVGNENMGSSNENTKPNGTQDGSANENSGTVKPEVEENTDKFEQSTPEKAPEVPSVQPPTVPVAPPAPPVVPQEQSVNILNNVKAVASQKVMKVKNDNIVVREGSLSTSASVGTLRIGDYVDVYEQNTAEGWSKINFEGKMSYVNTADLEDIAVVYKEAIEDNVTVRSGAGVNYSEFGILTKSQRVQVYQELSNGWAKINYNGKIAFVESTKLQDSYKYKATVALEKVNVYEGTQSTSKVIGEAKKGEILFVYGEEGDFYKVKYGESYAYIKKSDLKVIENTDKPQTGDAMIFSYVGSLGVSVLGMVSVNRKKRK